ncbi:Uncharacterized protein LW93_1266 [Fusarium fujikuroi]|nr:Uncharacterized protein LW93_1266 [Fusarium fujikuroi]
MHIITLFSGATTMNTSYAFILQPLTGFSLWYLQLHTSQDDQLFIVAFLPTHFGLSGAFVRLLVCLFSYDYVDTILLTRALQNPSAALQRAYHLDNLTTTANSFKVKKAQELSAPMPRPTHLVINVTTLSGTLQHSSLPSSAPLQQHNYTGEHFYYRRKYLAAANMPGVRFVFFSSRWAARFPSSFHYYTIPVALPLTCGVRIASIATILLMIKVDDPS